jgi:uncharacterized repeat protein (TIGR02543 family)
VASSLASGSQAVDLATAGTYGYTLTASGPGGNVTAAAAVSVTAPQYTLTTAANGPGTVSAGGTYPANTVVVASATPSAGATFGGWTGSLTAAANPLSVTLTGNISLTANFSSPLAQTITFAPPATATFPGPSLTLAASATSGLPVSFALVSGPGQLSGAQLSPIGMGPLVIQASQPGNAQWQPAPPVDGAIQVNPPAIVARIRFNASGHDARVTPRPLDRGLSLLWTDPANLAASPWPALTNPLPATPMTGAFSLPAVPTASP